jgi:hypothetical protein
MITLAAGDPPGSFGALGVRTAAIRCYTHQDGHCLFMLKGKGATFAWWGV